MEITYIMLIAFESLPIAIAIVACVYMSLQTPRRSPNLWFKLGLGVGAFNCLILILLRLKWLQTYIADGGYTGSLIVINAWTLFNISVAVSYMLIAKGVSSYRSKLEQ